MKAAIDLLCALTSLACAVLLLRGYSRSRFPMLLWSGLCFVGFLFGNVLLLADEFVYPDADLFLWRKVPTLVGVLLLLYGMVMEGS